MACPKCGCKVHYQYNNADFGPDEEDLERCSACGHIFYIEDAADDEDDAYGVAAHPAPSAQGPAELWLQLHGDCHDSELTEPVDYTSDDVTWCWHRIHASDVRYVRADLAGNAGVTGRSTSHVSPSHADDPSCSGKG